MSRLAFEAWWPLTLFVVAAIVVLLMAANSRTALTSKHRRVLTVLRIAALAAAAIALMRPVLMSESTEVSVVYALDVSKSIAPDFIDVATRWIDKAQLEGKPANAKYLVFADTARYVSNTAAIRTVPLRTQSTPSGLDQRETNIEAALDAALYGLQPEQLKRLVLISDGNATQGDAWRALDRLRRENVRVFTFPTEVRAGHDVWIEGIDVARDVRRDEPVFVTVRVRSQTKTGAEVVLKRAGAPIAKKTVQLETGENRIPFTVRFSGGGAETLLAEIAAQGDVVRDNDKFSTGVFVQGRPQILFVEGTPEGAEHLSTVLAREGMSVKSTDPANAPSDMSGFSAYDAVILSDVVAKDLGEARMLALSSYVRDGGGGILFAAGANVYGDQGYRDSSLEKILPVSFEAQEKKRDLALLIVLDRSYSMKGRKLDLAKAATLGALDLLEEDHRFGVVTFDSQPEITVPLAPARGKRKAEDLIARFTASGQTNIYPALQMAYRVLVDLPLKTKHVILLSDGDTQPADFQRLVKRMNESSITVTTVGIGADADVELLENISKWGKGRFYATVSADEVPQIFVDETQRLVNESFTEEPFRAVLKSKSEALRGIDFERAPPLKGFVATKPKERAEISLLTEKGTPLLARWQYGLGRAVVFTSDVKNRWAADWIGWDGYGKLFSQIVREAVRRSLNEETEFIVTRDGNDAIVRLSLLNADGGFRNGLNPQVKVTQPNGQWRTLPLRQMGPGRYELRLPLTQEGAMPWRFELADAATKLISQRTGVRELYPTAREEFKLLPPDQAFLKSFAEQTGGRYAPEPKDVFADYGEKFFKARALWPWFAGAALLLYVLDLLVRRAPWIWRRFGNT